MTVKNFSQKKIIIRKLDKKDLKNVKEFQIFINSLIEEGAQILMDKKLSLEEERKWLKGKLESLKKKREVFLIAENKGRIVGTTGIDLDLWKKSHVGNFGITIKKGYRGIGLGKRLMEEIIKLARKELKPRPRIIRLSVFSTNKPAISLYRKMGFKKVAVIPKQIKHKGKFVDEIIMLKF